MKNLFKIALTMLAVIAIGTSCNQNNTKPTYSTFVTAVEGSWDIPYYIVFDDGTTAAVENYKIWTPSFTEDWKELRYIIYYTETELTQSGYDKVINLTAYQPISMSKLTNATVEDFTKKDGLDEFTSTLDIQEAYFSPARNFLTMSVLIPYSDSSIKHNVKIVRNTNDYGPFKEYHNANDNYLWLEAYHDNNDDSDSYQAMTYLSLKIKEDELGIGKVENNYKGIKIIYNSYEKNKADIYQLDFHPNN